jgi:hypothetical protein
MNSKNISCIRHDLRENKYEHIKAAPDHVIIKLGKYRNFKFIIFKALNFKVTKLGRTFSEPVIVG